jgi:hypothetical protein
MQTLAGVLLAFIAISFLAALMQRRGGEWLRSKFLGA